MKNFFEELKSVFKEVLLSKKEIKDIFTEKGVFLASFLLFIYYSIIILLIPIFLLGLPFMALNEVSKKWFYK